jgi:hypothetical protein
MFRQEGRSAQIRHWVFYQSGQLHTIYPLQVLPLRSIHIEALMAL